MERPKKIKIEFILAVCCSCKRPQMLRNALESVNILKLPENIRFEVLVVDNDENCSAKEVTEKAREILKVPVNYCVQPKRGLAYARNKSLEEAVNLGASHILMFDDDEFFDENCLIEQIRMYEENPDAYIISGPVPTVFTEKFPSYITKNIVFKQPSSKKTGTIKPSCAAGNVFMPITPIKERGLRFSEEFVFSGGEDGDFFRKASLLGYTIVWDKEAIIYESVSESRANIKYLIKKSYYNGFAGASSKFKTNKNLPKKMFYIIKNAFICIFDAVISPFISILYLPAGFNIFCMSIRSAGKVLGVLSSKPAEFYKNVYGE